MDLCSDLILEILKFVDNPFHLASACRVNRIFHRYAAPLLYESIAIHSKGKTVTLFATLSRHPHLASFVRSLEIRDCPQFFGAFVSDVLDGLQHCINLRSCTWTRDRTITSQILETLSSCPNLRELELNGHSDRRYDPHLLQRFRNLEKVSIIMPSTGVVNCLEDWLVLNHRSLRSLSLICTESTLITDSFLESIAPSLPNLEHLHISGCPRLTNRSVWALLFSNPEGLLSLGLEGLSLSFDILGLCLAVETLTEDKEPHPLRRLHSITLSVPPLSFPIDESQLPMIFNTKLFVISVTSLLSQSSLEKFHIYPTSSYPGREHGFSAASERLWHNIVRDHGRTLTSVSIYQIVISFESLETICRSCTKLEELFVVVVPGFRRLRSSLSLSKTLRTIHINYPRPDEGIRKSVNQILWPTTIRSILKFCSSTITQFGCGLFVWEVKRVFVRKDDGLEVRLLLEWCARPNVPEQFVVLWA